MQHCYSTLTIKSTDASRREFVGIATTPHADLVGDIVEPKGARFNLPLPLLLAHDQLAPIGHVMHAKIGDAGIEVRAQLARVDEPGALKDRLDTAWLSIRSGLMRGLSIGFKPVESEGLPGGNGRRFKAWQWLELSCCVIPMNTGSGITAVKAAFAARGRTAPVVYLNGGPRRPGVVYLK